MTGRDFVLKKGLFPRPSQVLRSAASLLSSTPMDTRAYTVWITEIARRSHVVLQTLDDGTALATHFYPGGRT